MKTKIFTLIFFLLLTFFVYKVYAQEGGPASIMSQNKIRTCLSADPTIPKTRNRACLSKDPEDEAECEERGEWILGEATEMHLTGICEAPSGCEIWHENSARPVSGIEAGFRKIVNNVAAGNVDITVPGPFRDHVSHKFYAIGDAPVVETVKNETGQGGIEAENQTQQIGQVSNFETLFPTGTTNGSQQSCAGIYWDPFGRVFDAVSLEPISGIKTTLFQNTTKQLVLVPNNPTLTDKRGVYNILIGKEDDYYLNVTVPATHIFSQNVELNPKYSLIYSHIYSPGEVFHEGPLPPSIPEDFDFGPYQHDIPLQPKGEPYRAAVAEVVEGSLNQVDLGSFVNYWGQVTYPMANVCLVGETSGIIGCTNADKYGNFQLNIDKLSVPQEFMEIKVEKVDLTSITQKTVLDRIISFFVKEVKAQSSITIDTSPTLTQGPGFSPILTYIEGYAYDDSTSIVPMAKITVKLKTNDKVFYQTIADETGFFIIYSDNLPFFEYYLEIQSSDGNFIKQTTTQFIDLNRSYLESENLNLIASTRTGEPIINPTTGQLNEKSLLKNQDSNQTTPIPAKTSFNSAIITLLVVIILLVTITIGLALYIKKSKSV